MINYDLKKIKAVILDVDGVLSAETIPMSSEGEPLRTVNIKDGYAIQLAQKLGLRIVVLTGGNTKAVQLRYERLGVEDIYMNCAIKVKTYNEFVAKYKLNNDEIIYMGDDIPDYEVMQVCGCPCCPADACSEIKQLCTYISDKNGGYGCVRDVIEQVLKVQDKWINNAKAFGW